MTPAQLRAAIAAAIYENTTGDITGEALQEVLTEMTQPDFPVATSIPAGGLLPNVLYDLGTVGNTTVTLAPGTAGMVNHYFLAFDTGSTAPTITWPAGVAWQGGSAPTINADKHYEVSILDGFALYAEIEQIPQ